MTTKHRTEEYLALQAIARILHNALLSYPSEALVQTFVDNQLGETWPHLANSEQNQQGRDLLQAFTQQWTVAQLDELKLDYGQLFFGPGEPTAMPWGSVYLGEQQLLNDDSTVALMAFYKQQQISFELEYNQPLDHIALFYAVLDQLLGQLAQEPDNKAALETMVVLLQQHMLPWSGRCLSLAIEHAETDFYKAIALLAADFETQLAKTVNVVPMPMRLFR
ncbi:TorD/DmsD family molecular chaperone [Shewanella waksmanii]|uniref:TorD/DmsD family molecular chaperone n=1 Tax=Shewanella waksmanii TaxID=213783 RepID=UPI00048ABC32|nr:molecular chaperone TorD family protein [Shewanella waksmanii]